MDSLKAKTTSINDQVVAITQQSAKLRNSMAFKHVPEEAVDGLKTLENSLTQISELLIPFEQRHGHLEALGNIGQVINSTLEVDEVLQIVMDTIIRLMGAERGFLMLRDERGEMVSRINRRFRLLRRQSELCVS